MNMKNTVILLIFLLSILGLVIGIYYSEDVSSDNTLKTQWEKIYEDNDGVLTITLEKKHTNSLSDFLN